MSSSSEMDASKQHAGTAFSILSDDCIKYQMVNLFSTYFYTRVERVRCLDNGPCQGLSSKCLAGESNVVFNKVLGL